MKHKITNLITFLLIACIVASSSFMDLTGKIAVQTVTEITQGSISSSAQGTLTKTGQELFSEVFGVAGINKAFFKSNSKYYQDTAAFAAEEDTKLVFFDMVGGGGAFVDNGSVLEMMTSSFNLAVARVFKSDNSSAPFAAGTTMEFAVLSGDGTVISLDADADTTDNRVTVRRKGPGRAIVAVTVTENGQQRYGTITIHVNFQIVQTASQWENTGLAGYSGKVLFLDQRDYIADPYYQLSVLYLDNAAINTDSIILDDTDRDYDDTVVAYSNGKLEVKGAGYTKVTLMTTDYLNPDKQSFYVLVSPVGHSKQMGTDGITLADYEQTHNLGVLRTDQFAVYTNAKKASSLKWSVYVVNADETTTLINPNDTSRLTYEVSQQNNVVNFSGVTAGRYRIISEANPNFIPGESRNRTVYDVIVMVSLENKDLYLNVGDTYDILKNSNIPENLFSKIYFPNKSANFENFATLSDKGLVTAKSVGTCTITYEYKGGSSNALFDAATNAALANPANNIVYTIHIIDYLSINNASISSDGSSNFTMYAGGQYPLYASVTNKDYDVHWESLNEDVVKLEEYGSAGVMAHALKKGTATIRAYQVINGVEKNTYCTVTVKNTATKITLDPSNVDIEIGDYKTIIARYNGDAIDLTWVTSDNTVFDFVDGINVGTSATIEAKKPGKAILSAINPDNIVVGFCEVNVFQEVTGISLSETELKLEQSMGTYQLYAKLEPYDVSDSSVTWTSSKPSVVSVDANGKLTLNSAGEATIIVQSNLNPEFYAICNVTVLQKVDSIKLDAHELELYKGETYRLPYVISPKDANDDTINITIFDNSICTVTQGTDHTLLISGKKVGTTTFMVMTQDGKYWDLCTVTVKQVATDVKMNYSELTLNVGQSFNMEVTLTPADATEASLKWDVIDSSIASVSQTGRITGISAGTTTVLVTTQSGKVSYCKVTVNMGAVDIRLDDEYIVIDVGETYTIDVIFEPANVTNQEVIWSSLDDSVAVVNNAGMVTGLRGGHTVIVAESKDGGFRGFCLVDVEEPIQSITVDPEKYILGLGKSIQVTATIKNNDTVSDDAMEWYSDDEYIATVDQTGKITGMNYGETFITVEAVQGDAKAIVLIEVVKEVEKISINSIYETIVVGHNFQLEATVLPYDSSYQNVKYTVVDDEGNPDSRYAVVDDDGLITGIKAGSTWVIAEAMDNSGKIARCRIVVIDPISASGITLSDTQVYIMPGEEKSITPILKPANSTDSLIWTTNNDYIASVDDNGTITGNNLGQTTIQVMTTSGKTAIIDVTVLGLSRTYVEMPIYTTFTVYLDGTQGTVRWDVDDLSICTVTNGVITAKKVGTTRVTATVHGRTLECTVRITAK